MMHSYFIPVVYYEYQYMLEQDKYIAYMCIKQPTCESFGLESR